MKQKIEVDGLNAWFKNNAALKNVSLHVDAGEFGIVVARNTGAPSGT